MRKAIVFTKKVLADPGLGKDYEKGKEKAVTPALCFPNYDRA
jgi:hypothetical protein